MEPNQPNPQQPSWKDAANPAKPTARNPRDWHHANQPDQAGKGLSRKTLAALLSAGILVLVVAIIAVIKWPRPVPPPHFVLVSAGYETNLAVLHNSAGRNGLNDIESWASGKSARLTTEHPALSANTDPLADLKQHKSKTVVIFLSAHGGADSKGAYFLCNDATFARDSSPFYRLDSVLNALEQLPRDTHKLLLLDATQTAAHWSSGQLYNDFAGAVLREKARIAAIENLAVICSSGPGQRSWVAEEWRRTAFAHYVLQGLKGAAMSNNGRVDALGLFRYVERKVQHWARHNRGALQKPFILGEATAEECELVAAVENAEADAEETVPPLPGPKEFESNPDFQEVSKLWCQAACLAEAFPSPAIYTPHLWRRYLDAVLRHEQLVRAGDQKFAAELRKTIGSLSDRIERGRVLEAGAALEVSLAMPAAFGAPASALQAADGSGVGPYQRLLAAGAELRTAETAPEKLAASVFGLFAADAVRLAPRPAEAHFLAMLHPSAARADRQNKSREKLLEEAAGKSRVEPHLQPGQTDLLGKALRLRRLAEEAALGLGGKPASDDPALPAYSERVLPHIRSAVEEADASRRQGENLLFADDAALRKDIAGFFSAAEKGYKSAQQEAIVWREANYARDTLLAELPRCRHRSGSDEADVGLLVNAWKAAHKLDDKLNPSSASQDSLSKLTDEAKAARDKLKDNLLQAVDAIKKRRDRKPDAQREWLDIEAILQVPFLIPELSPRVRLDLIRRSQEISYTLHEKSAEADFIGDLDSATAAGEALEEARRQEQLALAVLNVDKARSRDTEQLIANGKLIGDALQKFPEESQEKTAAALLADLGTSEPWKQKNPASGLGEAARLARRVEGAAADVRLTADPVGDERRVLLQHFLCWQAERAFQDFWAGLRPSDTPYYRESGLALTDAAAELLAAVSIKPKPEERDRRLESVNALRKKLNADLRPVIRHAPLGQPARRGDAPSLKERAHEVIAELHLTDERRVGRIYQFDVKEGMPQGKPVVWVECDPGLTAEAEELRRSLQTFGKRLPLAIVPVVSETNRASHTVRSLFRGHESAARTQVHFHRQPDLVLHQPPVTSGGRIAVRSPSGGAGYMALALVLDCSGSMKEKDGSDKTRFRKVREALIEVLESLPEGTIVSLQLLGGLDVKNEQQTKQEWVPRPWERKRIDELKKVLSEEEDRLSGGTPLVDAILEAKVKGFPPKSEFDGFRTIVVITDGAESKRHHKADATKAGQNIEDDLVEGLSETGITLNVIGIDINFDQAIKDAKADNSLSQEEKESKVYQLERERVLQPRFKKTVTEKLKGSYATPAQGNLAEALRNATGKIRFVVDPAPGRSPLEGGSFDISVHEQQNTENLRWTRLLPSGNYTIHVPASRSPRQRVNIEPGDSLILDLAEKNEGRPAFRRTVYAESTLALDPKFARKVVDPKHIPALDAHKWVLGVLQNAPNKDGGIELMTTLEKDVGIARPTDPIQQIRPSLAWFEVAAAGSKDHPRLHVESLPGYPAPAWGFDLPHWPLSQPEPGGAARLAVPSLSVWWAHDNRPVPAAGSFSKIRGEFGKLEELAGKTITVSRVPGETAELIVQSVTMERRDVEVARGKWDKGRDQKGYNCLVVRLLYPKDGEPFFVLPTWEASSGQWHRFYHDAGMYVGVFWDAPGEEKISEIEFVSVAGFKHGKNALKVQDHKLITPNERPARPKPPGGKIQTERDQGDRP